MPLKETAEFERLVARISRAVDRIPKLAGAIAVNFSKERFVRGNWFDNVEEPWKPRGKSWNKRQKSNRAILVKTARLKRSIRLIIANANMIIIGTDVPYAQIHNDGGHYRAVQQVGSYSRKAYKVKAFTRTRDGRSERVKRHNVKSSTVKSFRRTLDVHMPRRRFLGPSAELNRRLEKGITLLLSKAITGNN